MPKSLVREFEYDPDIISEELVKFQQFLHNHHRTIENYINRAIDCLFFTERRIIRAFTWLEKDAPQLIIPTLEVSSMVYITYLANKTTTPLARFGSLTAMGLMAGLLTFPSWRTGAYSLMERKLVYPFPYLQKAVAQAQYLYWRNIYKIVDGWDSYDRTKSRIVHIYQEKRRRIISFFKPRHRPD